MAPEIQSAGPPPERHADRVVAEMLRHLTVQQIAMRAAVTGAICSSSDGSPRSQRKLAQRIERAGAFGISLEPGKRGQYTLGFVELVGWDPVRDGPVQPGDELPEKPWLGYCVCVLKSRGRGFGEVKYHARPILFMTHHALSRAAQRWGVRTVEHLVKATKLSAAFIADLVDNEQTLDALDGRTFADRVVQVGKDARLNCVITQHDKRPAVVIATVY
jgi:hypothetical protein